MGDGKKIAVIGDGQMGTVCSMLLAEKGCRVDLWSCFVDHIAAMRRDRENRRFLPGFSLPESVRPTANAAKALKDAALIISAVPCQYLRLVWEKIVDKVDDASIIVSVTKGIENETLLRPTEILQDVAGRTLPVVALSGPTIADELARRLPATATAASGDLDLATIVQDLFTTPWFRIYTNPDLPGVELAGATKNVIAIAAGIIDGLKAGSNAKAALLTRGLVEIARLGKALGARAETFSGLSGMGDLVTTCISPLGRNRSLGQCLGEGLTLDEARGRLPGVAEGVATTRSVLALSEKVHVEMPIARAVYRVLFEQLPSREAIEELMRRRPKAETS